MPRGNTGIGMVGAGPNSQRPSQVNISVQSFWTECCVLVQTRFDGGIGLVKSM
jgi:hypothetical protein